MSWQQNMQAASFRGVQFDVVREHVERRRAISRHTYPYVDGADLEDMGADERVFVMSVLFWGDDYDTRLQAFVKVLDQAGYGELIHPIYGSIPKAQLEDYRIAHQAEDVNACQIELRFAEATPGNPFFVKQLASQQAGSASALGTTAQASGFAAFASSVSSVVSTIQGAAARVDALRNVMNYTMSTLQGQVQGVIASTLDVIAFPLTFTSGITSFVSAMASIPSFAIGTIKSDWQNFVGQMNNVASLPASLNGGTATTTSPTGVTNAGMTATGASGSGSAGSGTSGTGSSGTSSSGSGTTPTSPTAIQSIGANPADVQAVTAAVQLIVATQLATTAAGILADESQQPTLAPPDIEQIVNDVRTSINTAIAQQRALYNLVTSRPTTEPLKDMALAIQQSAIRVIDQAPQITTKTVNAPGNLTLIAFWWYGDYTRADELSRLNPAIRNPNFILAGTVLNAYAN